MRLTAFIVLIFCLHVSAAGVSQNISFTGKKVKLLDVFASIEQQTGFVVTFDEENLQNAKTVSLDVKDMPLADFLNKALRNQSLGYLIEGRTILLFRNPAPVANDLLLPPINITGKITIEQGEPAAGVTVTVKGSKNAVSTDASGSFTLQGVDDDATLLVTGINIETKEIKLKGRSSIDIAVKTKVISNDPVTVTAYGIERKTKEIGYSVAKVSGQEINKANSGNLLSGLVGKVSGLGIATQSSDMTPQMRILLRGIRSFGQNSNNQPLFIFNGAPISFGNDQASASLVLNFINNFNPADIEDVTILKGANGTALYGPEGVNGVIIITTKKAAKGLPVIGFRSNNSFQVVDFRRENQQHQFGLGSGQVDQFGNGIYDPRGSGSWGPKYDGSLVPIGYPDEKGELQKITYSDKDDYRKFFNTALTNRLNLSFSQADATSSYYLGIGYLRQTGLLPGDKQNQANVLLNTSKKFGNSLNVQTTINFSHMDDDRGLDLASSVRATPTYIPLLSYKNYQTDHWSMNDNYYTDMSPYEKLANARTKSTTNAINGSLIFELKLLDWLNLREQPGISYSGYYSKYKNAAVNYSDYARQNFMKSDKLAGVGESTNSNTSLNNDVLLSAVHKAGNFLIRVNAGNTIRQNYTKIITAGAALSVPVFNIAFASYGVNSQEDAILSRTISAFGNASIGYKDMIFFELTGRNEWDSKRAKVARGKDFYSSANTSLILNELVPALKTVPWLSGARLRASLAKSANMNISPYASERILTLANGYPYTDPNTGSALISYNFYANNNPNPNIKPEKVFSQEYGLSAGFFKDRITLDATYYYQVNNSVILNVANAWLSGYPSIDNAGRFQNHGWEFDINVNPLITLPKNFNISLQARGAINKNKVLSLTPVYNGLFPVFDPGNQRYYARTGKSAFEFAVTDFKRSEDGKVIVDKNTGFPIPEDYGKYAIRGNTLPQYSASFGLNFSYKRFTWSVFADYIGGFEHLFSSGTGFFTGTDPRTTYNNRQPYIFPNSVYDDGTGKLVDNTNVLTKNAGLELYQNHSQVSLYGLTSGSVWKIREVAVQYTLPVRSGSVKELVFSIYGRDLFSFYPKSNIYGDPSLIRGPGAKDPNIGVVSSGGPSGISRDGGNQIGGASEVSALPGTAILGFTISATF